ncbi:MAG: MaoC family dehydratase N-terminal domain-containing protein [Rhodospirillaceae bacterium]|nr:MaoC family dehydratase N-terminal domain-containing protein [Rhodospirillaceae bacterium]MDE0619601.1 MaoC family dehydratase N-terminal domain-containing protein [Rhodospirillaceae bacterium]
MNMDRQGHVFPPFTVQPEKALAEKLLRGQGTPVDLEAVPPTYMIFLRGETRGTNLFEALGIDRRRALHGGQRYEWYEPVAWDEELTVTAKVETITEKQGRSGRIWCADVALDYARADGTRVLREITRLIERE